MPPTKTLEEYLRLPYRRVVEQRTDDDGTVYYLARIAELPFVEVDGDTPEEAAYKLTDLFVEVLSVMVEEGREIPEPEQWPGGEIASVPQELPLHDRREAVRPSDVGAYNIGVGKAQQPRIEFAGV